MLSGICKNVDKSILIMNFIKQLKTQEMHLQQVKNSIAFSHKILLPSE